MNVEELERTMPVSVDAERAILGAILLDNYAYVQAASSIHPSDFALDSHRRIYLRMCELADTHTPIDFVTLTEALGKKKEVEAVGGVQYITSLTDGLPRVKNISQYVEIVRDRSMLRQLIHTAQALAAQAYNLDGSALEIVAAGQQRLIEIASADYTTRSLSEIALSVLTELDDLLRTQGECIGAPSGIPDLDMITTGFRDQELAIVGARPGNGKTAFMCQCARENLLAGKKVGLFSLEVPSNQIMLRLACAETGIQIFDTRDPRILDSKGRYGELQAAIADIAARWKDSLFIDDTPLLDIGQLCARARSWIAAGVDETFVDYLQIVNAPGKDEYQRVTNATVALWALARSTKRKIVVLSQLNRNKTNAEPTMEDLRNSGAIENFAQLILLLYRDLTLNEDGAITGFTGEDKIIIPKQRSGPSQTFVPVKFNAPIGTWIPRWKTA